jgi:Ca2+-binding RTX toxin-like protein
MVRQTVKPAAANLDVVFGPAAGHVKGYTIMAIITGHDYDEFLPGTENPDTIDAKGGADNVNAGGGDDTVYGGNGNDTIMGNTGNDTLYGDGDDDTFLAGFGVGGQGNDTMDGGWGFDTVSYSGTTKGVTVNLEQHKAFSSVVGSDTLHSVEHVIGSDNGDSITGYNSGWFGIGGADTLDGAGGDDSIFGLGGDDTIHGGAGNDKLYGDGGNDHLFGDAGVDTLFSGDGTDVVDGGDGVDWVSYKNLSYGFQMSDSDSLTQVENVQGSAFDDFLRDTNLNGKTHSIFGGTGNDTIQTRFSDHNLLVGGDGDDTFNVVFGNAESLEGGQGKDTFSFGAPVANLGREVIRDFQPGVDKIQLFAQTTPIINAVAEGDHTVVHATLDGSQFEIQLSGLLSLTSNDFIIV